jgi:hypothetical protein
MDDDFENDIDVADEDLNESLSDDLGDLGEGSGGDVEAEFEEAGAASGTRATGGARANAKLSEPAARAARPTTPKAKKAATPAKKSAPVKAAKKKAAPKKKAAAKKKKAAPKKKAAKKSSRKAGRKK